MSKFSRLCWSLIFTADCASPWLQQIAEDATVVNAGLGFLEEFLKSKSPGSNLNQQQQLVIDDILGSSDPEKFAIVGLIQLLGVEPDLEISLRTIISGIPENCMNCKGLVAVFASAGLFRARGIDKDSLLRRNTDPSAGNPEIDTRSLRTSGPSQIVDDFVIANPTLASPLLEKDAADLLAGLADSPIASMFLTASSISSDSCLEEMHVFAEELADGSVENSVSDLSPPVEIKCRGEISKCVTENYSHQAALEKEAELIRLLDSGEIAISEFLDASAAKPLLEELKLRHGHPRVIKSIERLIGASEFPEVAPEALRDLLLLIMRNQVAASFNRAILIPAGFCAPRLKKLLEITIRNSRFTRLLHGLSVAHTERRNFQSSVHAALILGELGSVEGFLNANLFSKEEVVERRRPDSRIPVDYFVPRSNSPENSCNSQGLIKSVRPPAGVACDVFCLRNPDCAAVVEINDRAGRIKCKLYRFCDPEVSDQADSTIIDRVTGNFSESSCWGFSRDPNGKASSLENKIPCDSTRKAAFLGHSQSAIHISESLPTREAKALLDKAIEFGSLEAVLARALRTKNPQSHLKKIIIHGRNYLKDRLYIAPIVQEYDDVAALEDSDVGRRIIELAGLRDRSGSESEIPLRLAAAMSYTRIRMEQLFGFDVVAIATDWVEKLPELEIPGIFYTSQNGFLGIYFTVICLIWAWVAVCRRRPPQ